MHGDDCKGRFGAHNLFVDSIQDRFTRPESVHCLLDLSFLVLHLFITSLDQFFKVRFGLLQSRAHGGIRTSGYLRDLPAVEAHGFERQQFAFRLLQCAKRRADVQIVRRRASVAGSLLSQTRFARFRLRSFCRRKSFFKFTAQRNAHARQFPTAAPFWSCRHTRRKTSCVRSSAGFTPKQTLK